MLQRCEQGIVISAVGKLKAILEQAAAKTTPLSTNDSISSNSEVFRASRFGTHTDEAESEVIYEAFDCDDDDDDDDKDNEGDIMNRDERGNKFVDFIRSDHSPNFTLSTIVF